MYELIYSYCRIKKVLLIEDRNLCLCLILLLICRVDMTQGIKLSCEKQSEDK